jgi:hypothetical protein
MVVMAASTADPPICNMSPPISEQMVESAATAPAKHQWNHHNLSSYHDISHVTIMALCGEGQRQEG